MHWQDMSKDQLAEAAARDAVVVVTVGATEQHGPHLPVGTDSFCAQEIAASGASLASTAGIEVVLAPPVWWGYSRDHEGFDGTLTVSHRTLSALLVELGTSVLANGFSRLLFLNGHGSNDRLLYYVVRDVQDLAVRPCAVAAVTYWKLAADVLSEERDSSTGGMAHACELETSLMMTFRPDLVQMSKARDERAVEYSSYRRQDLLSSGPVMAPDRFRDLTRSRVVGDPTSASADKGARWSGALASRTADLLGSFAQWPLVPSEASK